MNRRAVTLPEVLVVLVLAGVVTATISTLLRRQERFFMGAASRLAGRVSLRDAMGILPAELRPLAPAAGDVVTFSDSAIELRTTIGAGIICAAPGDGTIHVARSAPGDTVTLDAFAMPPQPGDVALVYDDASPDDPGDDRWREAPISAASVVTTGCERSPLGASSASHLRLAMDSATTASVAARTGSPLRLLRRGRYRLYRASTGAWFLGYAEWSGIAYGGMQPVSGPYAAYTRGGASGLSFRYFDADGTELFVGEAPARIARVDVVARVVGSSALAGGGAAVRDSEMISVRPRNMP